MKRLLHIEWIKLWNNRASRALIISYFVLITLIATLTSIQIDWGPLHFKVADAGIFNFPYLWHFNTFMIAFLKVFLAIIIVSLIANEYTYKTLKQNLIDGLSKREFITSKVLMIAALTMVSTVFLFILSMILGLIHSDYTAFSVIVKDLDYLFAYAVKLFGFFSFCFFAGMLVKRSAFALGFLFIWFIIVEFVPYAYLASQKSKLLADQVFQFFPFGSMWGTIPEPLSRLGAIRAAAEQVGETIDKDYSIQEIPIAMALLWSVCFIWAAWALLKRRDL
ncbi:MAG: hypothetical protein RLZZ241_1304 [Bacteroidota bacterium]|jgi:ABC-type transport system involved in multi-copper enzyme maturation permease subunit